MGVNQNSLSFFDTRNSGFQAMLHHDFVVRKVLSVKGFRYWLKIRYGINISTDTIYAWLDGRLPIHVGRVPYIIEYIALEYPDGVDRYVDYFIRKACRIALPIKPDERSSAFRIAASYVSKIQERRNGNSNPNLGGRIEILYSEERGLKENGYCGQPPSLNSKEKENERLRRTP